MILRMMVEEYSLGRGRGGKGGALRTSDSGGGDNAGKTREEEGSLHVDFFVE